MHHDLIFHFLKATSQNQDIYPLLEQHLDELDNNFASGLRELANLKFANQPNKAINIAKIIVKFSDLIEKFEKGNRLIHLEIAIAGYESALNVINWETYPEDWASIQQTLVKVYQQRQEILSQTITELKENTFQNKIKINDLKEQFKQEKQQSCDLKAQLLKVMGTRKYAEPVIDLQAIVSAIQEIKLPSSSFNTVILYDIENLTKGNQNPQFNFSLEDIIGKIKAYNLVDKIAGQYAYADWSNNRLKQIKPNIQQLGIETMQIFGFSNQKNAADIQLVIDAVELIHSKPWLQVFAIVSGDGGFSCLAKKLHEYGKVVIGCGYDNNSNKLLPGICDYFVRLPEPKKSKESSNSNNAKPTVASQKSTKNYQTVLEYLKTHQSYQSALKKKWCKFFRYSQGF